MDWWGRNKKYLDKALNEEEEEELKDDENEKEKEEEMKFIQVRFR